MTRRRRIVLIGIGGLFVLIHVVGIAGLLWLRTSLPQLDGRIALDGLAAPVAVERDRYGIVTIRADSGADAYFALGFVHAQDRLFQMEMTRRLGAGRLSEAVGDAMLETDRMTRTLGLYRQAEAQVESLPPDLLSLLDAYADGVNAYIANHEGAWPPEFYAMRLEPEPWRPADSLVWGRLMALQLSGNWREEYLRAGLAASLTPEQLDWLWPTDGFDDVAQLVPAIDGDPGSLAGASNAWAVAPQRSESGGALLAGDPHLALRLPVYWYLVRIVTPDWTLAGATAPGVPLIVIGHNDHVAWSFTTTHGDTQDLFIERIDPDDPTRYLTPDGPAPFDIRTETILVRGEETTLEVRETRHGPVISDIGLAAELGSDDTVVSLAWACLAEDDTTAASLFAMNRARNATELRAALDGFHCPLQNVVYADDLGQIGMMTAGRVPVRAGLSGGGMMPAEGWSGAHDWQGFIPPEELPQIADPARGWVANANNRVTGPDYPHHIAARWELPYRIDRIDEVLSSMPQTTLDGMTALQVDTRSLAAIDLVPTIVAMLSDRIETDLARDALNRLSTWDAQVDRDEPGPLILHALMKEAMRAVFADELGVLFQHYRWWDAAMLLRLLNGEPGADRWCDDVATDPAETCVDTLAAAFEAAVADIASAWGSDPAQWRWGEAHRAAFPHPLWGYIPLANRLITESVETDGDTFTVNRATPAIDADGARFPDVHAAGLRFAIDLADPGGARYVLAGGQSANIFSPHYDDLIPLWRDGQFVSIVGPADHILTLVPTADE